MKTKKILLLLFALITALNTFTPYSTYAINSEDIYDNTKCTDIYSSNDAIEYSNLATEPIITLTPGDVTIENLSEGAILMLASYSGENLVDVKSVPVYADVKITIASTNLNLTNTDTIKAFLWTDLASLIPLCESKTEGQKHIEEGLPENYDVVKYIPSKTIKVSENVLTNDMVTLGAGWSGNLTDGFTHTAGYTEPLVFAINSADGESYYVEGTMTNNGETLFRMKIGDSYPTDPYNGTNNLAWGVKSVGGGDFSILPVNKFNGTIKNLTCKKIIESGTEEIVVKLQQVGTDNMSNQISGMWNTNIGFRALRDLVNGTRNIGVGAYALSELQTGGRNIGVGTYSMGHMTYGENNISIGADSSFMVAKATDCIAIGKASLHYGKDLKNNIAIGTSALYGAGNKNDSEAYRNVAVGTQAGYYNGSHNNVFIGNGAGYNNNDYGNVFVGSGTGTVAGYHSTGNRLTVIGHNSGAANGKNSVTVIGTYAKGGGHNSTAIGYQAETTKANQVVLGNDLVTETLIKGDLIVRGTDGIKRQIVFNDDGSCSWIAAE